MLGCRSGADVSVAVPSPAAPVFLTATGTVHALAVGQDGALWAATGGGVLRWPSVENSTPRVWTVADGLPSNDARRVSFLANDAQISTAGGPCVIRSDGAIDAAPSVKIPPVRCAAGDYEADALGLYRRVNGRRIEVPLPLGSLGSHVSALCEGIEGDVLAALYGDGIYSLTGTRWTRLPDVPDACRDAVALARLPGGGLAVGTSKSGVWRCVQNRWAALPAPPSLPDADIQTLAAFDGALWAGTLDHGLLRIDGPNVTIFSRQNGPRSDSPRGLMTFQNRLYVRHATGDLDVFDGKAWRPAFSKTDLPRPQVYAMATDGRRLYLGGWAGWAAWDGQTWERHYNEPELAGQVVTTIGADASGEVWIGTQKAGIFRWTGGAYRHDYEAQGLTDDWITCLNFDRETPLVGTYTGGLTSKNGDGKYAVILKPEQFAVRAVMRLTNGQIAAATPLGVFVQQGKSWKKLDVGGAEAQALLPAPGGLWIGTRTGLTFVTNSEVANQSTPGQTLPKPH